MILYITKTNHIPPYAWILGVIRNVFKLQKVGLLHDVYSPVAMCGWMGQISAQLTCAPANSLATSLRHIYFRSRQNWMKEGDEKVF